VLKQLIIQLQKQDFSGLPGNRRLKVNRQQRQLCRDGALIFPSSFSGQTGWKKQVLITTARLHHSINGALIICPEGECTKPGVESLSAGPSF